MENEEHLNLHDRPINDAKEDAFGISSQVVDKVYRLIQSRVISPLSIALTGEWGVGKSSAINLLCNELQNDKKNIIIRFEPFLEGKFEIIDLLESFYLKLYSQIPNDKKFNEIIGKSIKSLILLARCRVSASAKIPFFGEGKIDYDIGKNVDDLLNLWAQNKPKPFTEQSRELSNLLRAAGYKLHIIIDEIDRLNAKNIINFLLFARILEGFDDLICIIAIDYKKIINKLMTEGVLGLCDYNSAKDYLDKLFQAEFSIHINHDKLIQYAIKLIEKIDTDQCLSILINSDEYETQNRLSLIFEYLSTPRQLKKWLIAIKLHYEIIKNAPNKIDILSWIAATIKHPILLENLSKHTVPMLHKKHLFLSLYIKEKYGLDISSDILNDAKDEIFLVSTGIITSKISDNKFLKNLSDEINKHPISEHTTSTFVNDFLKNTPSYIIILYILSCTDKTMIEAFGNYFDGSMDNTLNKLSEVSQLSDSLAFDLSNSIRSNCLTPKGTPSIDALNKIWREKVGDDMGIGNPYPYIVLFSLANLNINEVISQTDLAISEHYLHIILSSCGINNKDGIYNFDAFNESINNIKLNSYNIKLVEPISKKSIFSIITSWLDSVSNHFKSPETFSNQHGLIGVFYRYIQWGSSLNIDNRDVLSTSLITIFKSSSTTNQVKKKIIELITVECKKFNNPIDKKPSSSPLEVLFNNNLELLKLINAIISEIDDIKYVDDFRLIAQPHLIDNHT